MSMLTDIHIMSELLPVMCGKIYLDFCLSKPASVIFQLCENSNYDTKLSTESLTSSLWSWGGFVGVSPPQVSSDLNVSCEELVSSDSPDWTPADIENDVVAREHSMWSLFWNNSRGWCNKNFPFTFPPSF